MNRILILVNKLKPAYDAFKISGNVLNLSVDIATYSEVTVNYDKNGITINCNSLPLNAYNLIYFRTLFHDLDLVNTIQSYSKKHGILLVDECFSANSPIIENSKIYTYTKLAHENVPVIGTLFISNKQIEKAIEVFDFPLILKNSTGFQGKEVYLCETKKETEKIYEKYNNKHLIVQPYIENSGDLRLLVIGDEVVGAIKRSSDKSIDFRNNASQGGKVEKYSPNKNEVSLALQATKILNIDIAGVDLMYDGRDKQFKILEVNRAPQFDSLMSVTGINVPEKIMQLCKKKIETSLSGVYSL